MAEPIERIRGGWRLSTDRRRVQVDVVHGFVSSSYWARGIPRAIVERSIENSLCFGVYDAGGAGREKQVAFARVISDFATFAWIADVFVLSEHRGRGLGVWLMALIEIPHLCSAKFLTLGRGQGSGSWPVRVARRLVSARAW